MRARGEADRIEGMSSKNAFDILGIDKVFDLDMDDVQRKYVKLGAANHPDKFVDPIEQMDAAERISEINAAYHTVKDPESRANELLRAMGGASKEEDKSLPPTLLMEMMEIREELEEAIEKEDRETLEKLKSWSLEEKLEYLGMLSQMFGKAANGKLDVKTAGEIRMHLNALRYIERMLEEFPEEV